MTPDENQRIGQLERAVAKMEQRVDDLSGAVKDLSPIALAVARMEGTVARAVADVTSLENRLDQFGREIEAQISDVARIVEEDKDKREEREQAEAKRRERERADSRRSKFYLTVGCLTAILAPAGTIIAAVISS